MSEYAAEQEMELEALQAILMDDFQEVEDAPSEWPPGARSYRLAVRCDDEEEAGGLPDRKLDLIFAHTANYPDEAPLTKISSVQGMTSSEVEEVHTIVQEQVNMNMGMAMIYTIVTALKEWLIDQVAKSNNADVEDGPKQAQKLREAEEERLAEIRAHGTPVTPQTFLAWRQNFDAEKQLLQAGLDPGTAAKDKGPSGKAFFLAQEVSGIQVQEEDVDEASDIDFDIEIDDEEDDEDLIEELIMKRHTHDPSSARAED